MAKMLAVSLVAMLVVSSFLPSSAEDKTIKYDYPKSERVPANPYRRGCNPSQQCRSRRLMTVTALPKVSSHGLQHDIGNRT
ncbi:hypothetical protein CDL12_06137 [Handroanthus impetiginosus]|uniref:Rapid ALkalinization Factor n=1 Tax=Handroanthus impetiginosus TaxID=429701 RepID=A0A2G9HUI6_9LAMI|nr:hypothetical protein CDL12_06137 [Handroanthus impetiginosus]